MTRARGDGPTGRATAGRQPAPTGAARTGATPSDGPTAAAARAAFRERIAAPGHPVENARVAVKDLERAFAAGALQRTPRLDQMLADLMVALRQDEGQRLGGKSAEAARFILRAIGRELDDA